MTRIHVVTDSGSDLPKEVREKYNIHVVPLTIQFGEDIYVDGIELSAKAFYQALKEALVLPSTCQPSPADFVKCYESISKPGEHIISVHLSSELSGTYQSAVLASTMLEDRHIHVLDSKSASIGIGLVTLAVAEAVQNGASVEDAVKEGERVIEEIEVFFVVDTLEYLRRNGRIGAASAIVGSLLNIKPVLTLKDGIVTPYDKIRGKSRALKEISDIFKRYLTAHPNRKVRIGITHADSISEANIIRDELISDFDMKDILIEYIGATIGVHVGPGTVALLWYPL